MDKGTLQELAGRGVIRFLELEKHGVAVQEHALIRKQLGKIIGMGDYEFDDYLAECVELRKSIVAELEANEETMA